MIIRVAILDKMARNLFAFIHRDLGAAEMRLLSVLRRQTHCVGAGTRGRNAAWGVEGAGLTRGEILYTVAGIELGRGALARPHRPGVD
ncbi:hypothetical protein DN745_11550 [Bradymonas sediminis]|uniref:Uncharacterized protein n=1 Tax=Bradymonas sediminis TaxID=1548548 RepID=A0A2Z4FLT1_9DELT|nr:hypothetical protein DN745_11550 [Bradymonas sediminis]